jgi:hypothetical protein
MPRALAGGLCALVAWSSLHLAYAILFCPPHRAWVAAQSNDSAIVVARGERRQRDGDAVWVCETSHRLGRWQLHFDLDCYCAPDGMAQAAVEQAVEGSCRLDDSTPVRRCSEARCNHYLN